MPTDGLIPLPEEENGQPDLYSLFEAMTSLRQEISLQGRSFHQLEQTLGQFLKQSSQDGLLLEQVTAIKDNVDYVQRLTEGLISLQGGKDREAEKQEGFRKAFDYLIDSLLDTHDQFRRMDEQVQQRKQRKGWFSFLKKNTTPDDLHQSINLTLKKLNQRLDSVAVVPIAHEGIPFDPHTMKAVEIEESTSQPPNTVLAIFRQGYIHEDRVLRFAEVKVSSPQ